LPTLRSGGAGSQTSDGCGSGKEKYMRRLLSFALRRYPLFTGYDSIALSKPLALFAKSEVYAIATLRGGQRMLVPVKDHVGRVILYMGDLEPRISSFTEKFLRAGDCALDIGCNLGWFSLIASKVVGPSGLIHAFEPQPDMNALFRASLAMNSTDNVVLHEVALSDRNGAADLHVLAGNQGASRLNEETGPLWSRVRVPVVEAGAYIDRLELPPVRLIKIDVEGHEETIFRSAETFLRTNPEAVVFESAGSEPLLDRRAAQLLVDYGFELYSLDRSFLKLRLVPAKERRIIPTIDHVAIRKGISLP
jgi:FkbM family methyltransferase